MIYKHFKSIIVQLLFVIIIKASCDTYMSAPMLSLKELVFDRFKLEELDALLSYENGQDVLCINSGLSLLMSVDSI